MKMKRMTIVGIALLVLTVGIVNIASAGTLKDLAQVRAASAQYHRTQAAQEAGYGLVTGLDHCFENPGVGAMGFHYINSGLLDLAVNELEPEAMVYIPAPNGDLQLGAVEYIVPAAAWDAAGNSAPPEALGRSYHLNPALGVYVLHAWIWKNNPAGMFEDWNPTVSCP
jgi:hypothetical protein